MHGPSSLKFSPPPPPPPPPPHPVVGYTVAPVLTLCGVVVGYFHSNGPTVHPCTLQLLFCLCVVSVWLLDQLMAVLINH